MSTDQVQIRRLFRVVNGGTPTADPGNWGGEVQWLTPEDLGSATDRHLTVSRRTLTSEGQRAAAPLVPPGSLLLSTRAPIGHLGIVGAYMSFNQGCRALVPRVALDSRYFYWQLIASRGALNAAGQGSTFVELSGAALAAFRVRAPAPNEQRRIADFLDAETTRIDGLVSNAKRLLRLIGERVDCATSHILASTSMEPLSLRRVVERVEVGVVVQPAALYAPSGIPFLRGVNISPGRIALDDVKYLDPAKESIAAKSRLKAGDVVVVRTGQAGAAAAVVPPELEGANCVDLLIVHPGPDLVPRYLELLINSEFVRCQVATFDGRIDPIPFQRRSTARGLASRSRCHASIRSGG